MIPFARRNPLPSLVLVWALLAGCAEPAAGPGLTAGPSGSTPNLGGEDGGEGEAGAEDGAEVSGDAGTSGDGDASGGGDAADVEGGDGARGDTAGAFDGEDGDGPSDGGETEGGGPDGGEIDGGEDGGEIGGETGGGGDAAGDGAGGDDSGETETGPSPEPDPGPEPCIPGTVSCEGDTIVLCNPAAELVPFLACEGPEVCFDGGCCTPDCTGLACGDDGCGGSCGACEDGVACFEGACTCVPDTAWCAPGGVEACSSEGEVVLLGPCAGGEVCVDGACCVPDCATAECGDDGCGGSCGACGPASQCESGQCKCTPGATACDGEQVLFCTPEGKVKPLAKCGPGQVCTDGACCQPDCAGKSCGGDGCGGSCGGCAPDALCTGGQCCAPACDGAECGDDGCGGSCGSCDGGEVCQLGACDEPCEIGTATCFGSEVWFCDNGGVWAPLVDCAASGDVCAEGACEEPSLPAPQCPETCTGKTLEAALCAIDLCYPSLGKGASVTSPTGDDLSKSWGAIAHYGSADNDLAPWSGPSYLVLSSGFVESEKHQDTLSGNGEAPDPWATDGLKTYDAVQLDVFFEVPDGASGFELTYLFMSVEYWEWVDSQFSDKLHVVVNGALSTGGSDVVTTITTSSEFSEPCPGAPTSLAGTGFECAKDGSSTGWLRTRWALVPGDIVKLSVRIHDTSDAIYDSAVILDAFGWLAGPFEPGTVKL